MKFRFRGRWLWFLTRNSESQVVDLIWRIEMKALLVLGKTRFSRIYGAAMELHIHIQKSQTQNGGSKCKKVTCYWWNLVDVGFWTCWLRIWKLNADVQNISKNLLDLDENWYLVVVEVADYECELKVKKFKIVDLIWQTRSVKNGKFNFSLSFQWCMLCL